MKAPDDGSLPVGGTNGLSHEHSAAVEAAVEWLVSRPRYQWPRPLPVELKKLFGVTALEAVGAIRAANRRIGESDG